MGRNNLQLVGLGLCVVLVCFFVVITVLYTKDKIQNHDNSDSDELISDDSFKPMIKVEDEIYLWTGDIVTDLAQFEKIGEVKFSYETLNKGIDETDQNFTSNIYQEGAEVYRYDDSNIIIYQDSYGRLFEKGDW